MSATQEKLERVYEMFGYGKRFDPFPSEVTTEDLAEARLIGHARSLVYGSAKEGAWSEYEHEFIGRPAVYELGVEEGDQIEALLDVSEQALTKTVLLGDFIELTYEDEDGTLAIIEGPGYMLYEPETNTILLETEEGNFAIVGFRIGRWIMG